MPYRSKIDLAAIHRRVARNGAEESLTFAEATALIADRVRDDYDNQRLARNRVAMQLRRSMKQGVDVGIGGLMQRADGRFSVDEIARWCRRRYPDTFNDLPMGKRRTVDLYACATARLGASVTFKSSPGNVAACHELIRELQAEVTRLKEELLETQRKLERISRLKRLK